MSDSTLPGEVAYRLACCYASLGDEERAVDGLATALSDGFRDLERPRRDELWQGLRPDPRVRRLLGIVDAEAMSREEGWRTDVGLRSRAEARGLSPWQAMGEAEFDAAVSALAAQVGELSDAQILAELLGLFRRLEDGHACIGPGPNNDLNVALRSSSTCSRRVRSWSRAPPCTPSSSARSSSLWTATASARCGRGSSRHQP